MTQAQQCSFNFSHFQRIFETALEHGYQIVTLADYFSGRVAQSDKVLVNRMDVDLAPDRLWEIGKIFRALGICGSLYFRLHAPTYNLLRFDTISMVRWLADGGNEIGLHAEMEDVRQLCGLDPTRALQAALTIFRDALGCPVAGVSSHGDATGYNNLHFWNNYPLADFGLQYEAYDERLWGHCRYVSDSNHAWKAYDNGKLRTGDTRCICQHIAEGPRLIYLTTHTDSFYWRYVHEGNVPSPAMVAVI